MATRPKFQFHWHMPDGMTGGLVWANTTGEARAQIKKNLGIGSHGRLPSSVSIIRSILKPATEVRNG